MKARWFIAALALAAVQITTFAGDYDWIPDDSCPDQSSKVISEICIDCFFPIRMGIQTGSGGSGGIPDDAFFPVCACAFPYPPYFDVGVTAGGWMPEGIFEVTPREYCSSTLGGVKYGSDQSNRGIGSWGGGLTYYNVHYIPFPIASIKSVLSGVICGSQNNSESTQVGMWSELDPTWNDAKLAALKAPDGSIPLGPLLPLQCAAEYARMQVDSNYFGSPWCTGGSGQTYPLTGYVSSGGNPAKDTALTAARLLDEMYRAGAQKKTWGTLEMVCYGVAASVSVTPKNGHRMQQVAPRSEKGNHRIGDDWSASSVGVIGTIPGLKIQGHEVNNNNYIYVDWKYKECCAF